MGRLRRSRRRRTLVALLPLVVLLATAGALWPAFLDRGISAVRASTPESAPVLRDYADRDRLVAFWEGAVGEHHRNDMLSPRELAGQYLQRYREQGDIDDVVRAQHMAEQSLRIMPHNVAALCEMAAVMLTLHRFAEARDFIDRVLPYDPTNPGFLAQKASIEMELGRYVAAAATLDRVAPANRQNVAVETIRARYDELTGHLARARDELAAAIAQADLHADESAQSRAWYHVRAGELAFEAGDPTAAIAAEQTALRMFPTDNLALKDLAKFELATRQYGAALDAAERGAQVTPFVETLGYAADAQTALGQTREAAVTRATIFAIERLGNALHVNDRLLAVFYAEHGLRADDALAIAQREVRVRGDEIYAQDTLAWAAAMDGRWDIARRAAARAVRWGTQDPLIAYHAAIIALHFGQTAEAKRWFTTALRENPDFHPTYADDARAKLGTL